MTPYFQIPQSPKKFLYFRTLAPRRRIGDNQRRQTPGAGRTRRILTQAVQKRDRCC